MSDTGFSAFPEETLRFLAGIAFENSKDWFEANRDLYESRLCRSGPSSSSTAWDHA